MISETVNFWHWLILAAALATAEILLPGSVLIWLGLAAAEVGILLWLFPALSWEMQLLVFSLLSVINLVLGRKFFSSRASVSDHPLLNQRTAQFVGRVITLKEPLVHQQGYVVIEDSRWKVNGPDCPAGTRVQVIAAEGAVLKVKPIADPS